MNDKIKELQREIEREKYKMDNCNHDFGEVYDNYETQKEEYVSGYEKHGSDIWGTSSFRDKIVPRWSKKCKICGYEKHTYKRKPIIKGYEPDF